ncbi:hypothetical protein IWX49DRAFT_382229 [Phyllosticta citricarpa]|uniref:Uncharacterized protein n=1 Tax=Phyllosticta paracitricarpa TaxID=2016321 RepID=A0ABR1MT37_9PEZI
MCAGGWQGIRERGVNRWICAFIVECEHTSSAFFFLFAFFSALSLFPSPISPLILIHLSLAEPLATLGPSIGPCASSLTTYLPTHPTTFPGSDLFSPSSRAQPQSCLCCARSCRRPPKLPTNQASPSHIKPLPGAAASNSSATLLYSYLAWYNYTHSRRLGILSEGLYLPSPSNASPLSLASTCVLARLTRVDPTTIIPHSHVPPP